MQSNPLSDQEQRMKFACLFFLFYSASLWFSVKGYWVKMKALDNSIQGLLSYSESSKYMSYLLLYVILLYFIMSSIILFSFSSDRYAGESCLKNVNILIKKVYLVIYVISNIAILVCNVLLFVYYIKNEKTNLTYHLLNSKADNDQEHIKLKLNCSINASDEENDCALTIFDSFSQVFCRAAIFVFLMVNTPFVMICVSFMHYSRVSVTYVT